MLEEPSADRQGTEAMRSTDPSVAVIRYRRSKALAFGAMMLAIGAGIAWLAWDALDPGWTSPTDDGALLQALPYWVRVPFILAIATIVLTPGVTMVWSGLRNAVVVRADSEGISARTIFGRRRYLAWDDIVSARRFGTENQIILSPMGADTLVQEIWDRKSVLLDVGMLETPARDVEALLARHRPDLTISCKRSRDG
jgi:hypothetical protein